MGINTDRLSASAKDIARHCTHRGSFEVTLGGVTCTMCGRPLRIISDLQLADLAAGATQAKAAHGG